VGYGITSANDLLNWFYGAFPGKPCWPGRSIGGYEASEMVFGDPLHRLPPRRTPFTPEEDTTWMRFQYNFDTQNRLPWMLDRILRLNADLADLIRSLLGDNHGHMFHVSPPAPGPSACVCPICGRDLLLSFIVIYFDFLLFVYWGCCSVVRQLTLPEHSGGEVFRYRHRHDLAAAGVLDHLTFWVRGILGDDSLYTKYADPANVYEAVWGLPDLLVALCTDRPHPHATLVALRTVRPPRPAPGCVGSWLCWLQCTCSSDSVVRGSTRQPTSSSSSSMLAARRGRCLTGASHRFACNAA
jgi:hypothetical protein